jgi:hypothetical protein
LSATATAGTRRHAAGRRARARSAGAGSTRTGCRWTRNWPFHGLCRRERIVADARRASRRLGGRARAGCGSGTRRRRGRGRRRSLRGGLHLRRFSSRGRRRGRFGRPRSGRFGTRGFLRRGGGRFDRGFGRDRAVACGLLLRGFTAAERLTQPTRDRRFYCRRCGFDEFTLLVEPGQNFLAGNTEFLS